MFTGARYAPFLALAILLGVFNPAQAQGPSPLGDGQFGMYEIPVTSVCATRATMMTGLKTQWGEVPVITLRGLTQQKNIAEIHQSTDGRWALILSFPNGMACLLEHGSHGREPTIKQGTAL